MSRIAVHVVPADWEVAQPLQSLTQHACVRLDLDGRLAEIALVLDALTADDRVWFNLSFGGSPRSLTLWLHPDQILRDQPGRGAARRPQDAWTLGPLPPDGGQPALADFSPPNAQRVIYQQLLLVRDLLTGILEPASIAASLCEAFQEAWSVTLAGRLQRQGLPHASAAEMRLGFLHLFGPCGVLTPRHWALFNKLWEMDAPDVDLVLAIVRQLPPLNHRVIPRRLCRY